MPTVPRYNVLGVGIHALNLDSTAAALVGSVRAHPRRYVCCCEAHSLVQARRDPAHRARLNAAHFATPDGMPIVWLGRRAGHSAVGRVYGPDLMQAVCLHTADGSASHFFYGGGQSCADELAGKLVALHGGLRVAGTHGPPVAAADDLPLDLIRDAAPDFVWVGLSTPKQEAFMARLATSDCDFGYAIGVGAAFDFLTGRVPQAPRWIQRSGFEWLWRVLKEPRRLGSRYLTTVPRFAISVLAQQAGLHHYPLE